MLDVSRVTSKGQVTIPVEMRRRLGIKNGDKIVFMGEGNRIVIANAAMVALKEVQEAFSGVAERLGLHSKHGVADMVKDNAVSYFDAGYGEILYKLMICLLKSSKMSDIGAANSRNFNSSSIWP